MRKRTWLVAVAGLLAPVSAPPASAQQAAVPARVLTRDTLANGLRVVVLESHAVPLATVEIVVHNGAFTQPPGEEGYAHLFEHLLFRAYEARASEQFDVAATRLDAVSNATTAEERVTYYLTLPSDRVVPALHLLADLLRHPYFRDRELNRERTVVVDEIHRDWADPVRSLYSEVGKRLWGSAWSRKDPLGTPEVLQAATTSRIKAVYARYYVPNNAALIVGGDVDPRQVLAAAREDFGDWRRAPDPFAGDPIPPIPPLAASQAVVVTSPDAANATVVMEWQGPSVRTDPRSTYAADALSQVVDDPESTFQQRLVGTGLFQSVDMSYETLDHSGPIRIVAVTSRPQLRMALIALGTELTSLGDAGYVTPEELADAAKARRVADALELQHSTAMVHDLADWWSSAGLDYYQHYVDRMAEVTPDDIRDFARRFVVDRPAIIGVLTTPDDADRARRLIVDTFGGGHVGGPAR